jgi:phosphoribosyl 1,2-cyclic phosphodiesterase
MDVTLTFWGVRGSYPTPVSENLGVGGNTSCIEIRRGDDSLIIDAGTGIQRCGDRILRAAGTRSREISILFSHFHWDHVQGLPFFAPIYSPKFHLKFAGCLPAPQMESTLAGLMRTPHFPVEWNKTASRKQFVEVPRRGFSWKGIWIEPFPLNHPQGAFGYRIDTEHGVIVHASDSEHGDPEYDAILRHVAKDAAVLIYDAQYRPEEYPAMKGRGHSTWLEGAKLACEAGIGRLILFHHDPAHTDQMLESLREQACDVFPATEVAIEGLTIRPSNTEAPAKPMAVVA